MIKKQREYNYDLFRVICMISVIMIHVSAVWVSGFSTLIPRGGICVGLEIRHPLSACIYNTISRFAVPGFIMLSGAFILADQKNGQYLPFYKKSFYKLGVHTITFTILYTIYKIPMCFIGERQGGKEIFGLIGNLVRGEPMYHMWYMYMLIVLYLLAPVCVRFKNSTSNMYFEKVSIIFLIVGNLSAWTTQTVRLNWDIGRSFECLGYFMMGYVIRERTKEKGNNKKAVLLIIVGGVVEIIVSYVEYYFQIIKGIAEDQLKLKIVSPYSPGIVLASVLIFAGFSYLVVKERKWIIRLSEKSFIIYLIHAGVWDFICKLFHLIKGKNFMVEKLDNIYMIPICVTIVLLISLLLTEKYNLLFDWGMKRRKR